MKPISAVEDLALHGAPPAFPEPIHVGRPNVGDRAAFLRRTDALLDRRWLTNDGPFVRELEQRICEFTGVPHCVAMCNATVALEIAIRALGLRGDVIVPSYTFIATAHALRWQEVQPVFADINARTHNLDPDSVRRALTPRTTGIVGVHLWGRAAPVRELEEIARDAGLKLLFDAAHAFGCTDQGVAIGNFGSCEVFSFHATKFFNTFEGGAMVTHDAELAHRVRLMRNFGFIGYDNVGHLGTNGKMTEICAAMGLTNLDALELFRQVNLRHYEEYRAAFSAIPGISLLEYDPRERNNYQYVVVEVGPECKAARDTLVDALHAENVLARKYFWPGCHRMSPYRESAQRTGERLEVTEDVAARVIVLPTGTGLPEGAVRTIANVFSVMCR